MEDNVVVVGIAVVMVAKPVAGAQVYLYVARPQGVANLYGCTDEVWTSIGVVQARVEHFNALAVCGL